MFYVAFASRLSTSSLQCLRIAAPHAAPVLGAGAVIKVSGKPQNKARNIDKNSDSCVDFRISKGGIHSAVGARIRLNYVFFRKPFFSRIPYATFFVGMLNLLTFRSYILSSPFFFFTGRSRIGKCAKNARAGRVNPAPANRPSI